MEYCEKSTLRSCIDEGGLKSNPSRMWRYFRFILIDTCLALSLFEKHVFFQRIQFSTFTKTFHTKKFAEKKLLNM